MEYTKVSDKETRMVEILVSLYKTHPAELSTIEKVKILQALSIDETVIGQILAGDATLCLDGTVEIADYARGRH